MYIGFPAHESGVCFPTGFEHLIWIMQPDPKSKRFRRAEHRGFPISATSPEHIAPGRVVSRGGRGEIFHGTIC